MVLTVCVHELFPTRAMASFGPPGTPSGPSIELQMAIQQKSDIFDQLGSLGG